MQQLFFEDAWDRTLGEPERSAIEKTFEKTKNDAEDGVLFVPIRSAVNYRNDLLVITLIHNFQSEEKDLTDFHILLFQKDQELASRQIKEKRLYLPAKTSMPWTFIFPDAGEKLDPISPYLLKASY